MIVDLSNPIFHDEEAARADFESIRWPDGPYCPFCGSFETVKPLGGGSMGPGWYHCSACRDKFTVRVGTVLERSHLPLHKWRLAFQLICASKKGMSSHQLARMLNVSYQTAWFLSHRIRECMAPGGSGPLGGAEKYVEADETFIGGKARNRAYRKPAPKKAVVSLVERQGRVHSRVVADVNADNLRPILVTTVDRASHLRTDESGVYWKVGEEFASHKTVNHSADEYVRGDAYTNTVEGYFSILKRGIYGVYQHVSTRHLPRYLSEFDFRYSNRIKLGIDDTMRTVMAIKGAEGRRLTYRQPHQRAHL